MQLTSSSLVTVKMSCSSTHSVRDTQNLSAQKLSCPQLLMDCCHVSLQKMKASKGTLGYRIGPDRVC